MARAKKSDRLLQKLNQSLTEESAPTVAIAEAPSAVVEAVPLPSSEPVTSQVAASQSAEAAFIGEKVAEPPPAAGGSPGGVPAGRRARAEEIVRQYVPFAIGAGMIPFPVLDWAAIGGLQLKVLAALADHYRVPFSRAEAKVIVTSLLGSLGGTVVATGALGSLVKFVPGVGGLLGMTTLPAASGVITYAIGSLAIDHFETGGSMANFDLDVAHRAWDRKLTEAKRALGR